MRKLSYWAKKQNEGARFSMVISFLLLTIIGFSSISSASYCQSIFKITIQDFESKQSIENASLYLQQEQLYLAADKNGYRKFIL